MGRPRFSAVDRIDGLNRLRMESRGRVLDEKALRRALKAAGILNNAVFIKSMVEHGILFRDRLGYSFTVRPVHHTVLAAVYDTYRMAIDGRGTALERRARWLSRSARVMKAVRFLKELGCTVVVTDGDDSIPIG